MKIFALMNDAEITVNEMPKSLTIHKCTELKKNKKKKNIHNIIALDLQEAGDLNTF